MRKINKIIIHCSDSDHSYHDNIHTIKQWHLQRGFSDVGYHYFINKVGKLEIGRRIKTVGAHSRGQNSSSIGICLSGKKTVLFTDMQFKTLAKLCFNLIDVFDLSVNEIYAHNNFNPGKTCPNFLVESFIEHYMG